MIIKRPRSLELLEAIEVTPRWIGSLVIIFALCLITGCNPPKKEVSALEQSMSFSTKGKSLYDAGTFQESIEFFKSASDLIPGDISLKINLANALYAAEKYQEAESILKQILSNKPKTAAAHYLLGLIHKRNRNFEEALKSFQTSELLEPNNSDSANLNNLTFQIGLTHFELKQWDDAVERFFDLSIWSEDHPSVWYYLGQALLRAGREDEATEALDMHQQQVAIKGTSQTPERELEVCRHTLIYVPFVIETPSKDGIKVVFSDATDKYFNSNTNVYSGPFAILDFNHSGTNSLWAIENTNAFRLLMNSNAQFLAGNKNFPIREGDKIRKVLAGDIQNSGHEDILALGENGLYAFNMMTNGLFREQSTFAGLDGIQGMDMILGDFNYTGHLDVVLQQANGSETNLVTLENIGNYYFFDITSTSNVPYKLEGIRDVMFEDWNQDDMLDLLVSTETNSLQVFERKRGEGFKESIENKIPKLGDVLDFTTADLNNDLVPDILCLNSDGITYYLQNSSTPVSNEIPNETFKNIAVLDFDNDGWKDILVYGNGISIWRNVGPEGFVDQTTELGFTNWEHGLIRQLAAADMDNDGDTDLVLDVDQKGIMIFSNDGGNAQNQFKIRLDGTRSNRSGIGMQIELTSGNWRTLHTVHNLPIEIGIGTRDKIDSMAVRWSDASAGEVDIAVDSNATLQVTELRIATGSCPYLYKWDGEKFAFVTDLLGAAPLGLPANRGFLIPGDPFEFVELGNQETFKPKDDHYVIQVTEELREILYLDEAKLVVVDHPKNVEIFPTSKLVSGKPPKHELLGVTSPKTIHSAIRSDGQDILSAISQLDQKMASPVKLRLPQYRGLAEPWHLELTFDPITKDDTPVLVLNGWLQFGGGMANISSSLRKDFPFPFPTMEAWSESEGWKKVDVEVGAPAGKTKTIIVDLSGALISGTSKLRISTAFEIHWDQIRFMQKSDSQSWFQHDYIPESADLHFRGYSKMSRSNPFQPDSPDYDQVNTKPNWTHTPEGWCTRYGNVLPLIENSDDELVIMNGGDELTLSFPVRSIKKSQSGMNRSFFFYNVGWDKDADFHVVKGFQVEPLPKHDMNYQSYGKEDSEKSNPSPWTQKWNTRWVPGFTFERQISQR